MKLSIGLSSMRPDLLIVFWKELLYFLEFGMVGNSRSTCKGGVKFPEGEKLLVEMINTIDIFDLLVMQELLKLEGSSLIVLLIEG